MADSEPRTVKRSRFDQAEPEPKRVSRFDRRSRSPPVTKQESARERSPLPRGDSRDSDNNTKSPVDPAAAAAAAAAKINASLQARKGIQHVDVPPIRSSEASQSPGDAAAGGSSSVKGEMYISDGDYIKDIEVNDLRNRYVVTKGSTQKMIKDETGADVTTRGNYYPDKSMATAANPPLYLHITSTTKDGLDRAVAKINELINQELPQLVDERRFRRREQDTVERDEYGRRKWPEERIPITLEPIPGFNLRANVVGAGGAYVKHIQQETGCRVQIKGRGSGYVELSTGRESDDEMYLHVTGPDAVMVQKARELCEDLLANVKEAYEEAKSRPPRNQGGQGYHGERHHGHGGGGGGGGSYQGYSSSYSNQSVPGGSSAGHTGLVSPTSGAGGSQASPDYAAQMAQYAQYYGTSDPYAAYGGYQAYVALYQQWAASQGQGGQAPVSGASGGSPAPPPPSDAAPPPPPPPASAAPPPPPGGVSGSSGYNAVPPPPGL